MLQLQCVYIWHERNQFVFAFNFEFGRIDPIVLANSDDISNLSYINSPNVGIVWDMILHLN